MGAIAVLRPAAQPVDPGGVVTFDLNVQNTGSIVDEFTLRVLGDAAGWATIEPARLSLFPRGEASARVRFDPPRAPTTPAGPMPFGVHVVSREDPQGSVVEEGTLEVGPFRDVSADLVPRTSRGSRSGAHRVSLTNLGNVPLVASVAARDPDELLDFQLRPASVRAEPGASASASVRARARNPFWLGSPQSRPFAVSIEPEAVPPVTIEGSLLQQPIVPSWVPRALAAAVALVLVGAMLLRRDGAPDEAASPDAPAATQAAAADPEQEEPLPAQDAPATAVPSPSAEAAKTGEVVDGDGDVGRAASMVLVGGRPLIAYQDAARKNLKVVACGNAACDEGNAARTIDRSGRVGEATDIAIAADGNPIVVSYDQGQPGLRVVHCNDRACGAADTPAVLDTGGDTARSPSIAVPAGANPAIFYHDSGSNRLKLARCANADCSSVASTAVVDTGAGRFASAGVSGGKPVVAYYDESNRQLKLRACLDAACAQFGAARVLDDGPGVGQHASLAVGSDGTAFVAYYDETNQNLKLARCKPPDCGSDPAALVLASATVTVDRRRVGTGASLAVVGTRPVISYLDAGRKSLKVATCEATACTSPNLAVLTDRDVGPGSAVAVGTDGQPIVAWYDTRDTALRVARPA